ncbi:PREDICTED: mannosylglucosyl-3-phosphoglycerate phosphatase-like isoform X2 [Priapulus caudatus]|uniref:Mannosylglucosyl-3-phosphoglycerate phosphatase-like isoform X2 n=1 Tax=Priapulus caudatus TaxID=37621 RepID=A0ABM1DPP4_PRICU|nr:PREDICTED: mannosylglucosyl-3-phosphoglycerate phosphatase-like isoform X2 [Priapulus caudatus]
MADQDHVTILHFNDVYNIEPQDMDPPGGAARFITAIKHYAHLDPLVVFSGDALNPSLMSTFTKGEQMISVLNKSNVRIAVFGNHDFDHGVDELVEFTQECHFPWLMSNVFDNDTNKPLADGLLTHVVKWAGKKFGFVGLVEEEWLATLATVSPDDLTYIDYVEQGNLLAKQLKDEGVDYVIALTHMRTPNDLRLAENVDGIDLILGGHDHCFEVTLVNGKYVIKSGSDFRQLGKITLTFNCSKVDVTVEEITIDSSFEEDPAMKLVVDKYLGVIQEQMTGVLGRIDTELDGRFTHVRTQETNLGNMIADIMLAATHANVALYNAGTLRSDRVHQRGDFTMKDLISILPMVDNLVVLKITGAQLLEALENGVSMYPKLEGRFPQVAGVCFAFDPSKPAGSRVDSRYVKVGQDYLEVHKEYSIVTKSYIASGKDGYDVFKDCDVLMNEELCPVLITAVKNFFKSVNIVKGLTPCKSRHRQSLVSLQRRNSLLRHCSMDVSTCSTLSNQSLDHSHGVCLIDEVNTTPSHSDLVREIAELSPDTKHATVASANTDSTEKGHVESRGPRRLRRQLSVHDHELSHCQTPQVEGRIVRLDDSIARYWLRHHFDEIFIKDQLEHERVMHDVSEAILESDEDDTPPSPAPGACLEGFSYTTTPPTSPP